MELERFPKVAVSKKDGDGEQAFEVGGDSLRGTVPLCTMEDNEIDDEWEDRDAEDVSSTVLTAEDSGVLSAVETISTPFREILLLTDTTLFVLKVSKWRLLRALHEEWFIVVVLDDTRVKE